MWPLNGTGVRSELPRDVGALASGSRLWLGSSPRWAPTAGSIPYVDHWYEFESQDSYPEPGRSLARFFRNQEHLEDLVVQKDLPGALTGVEALVLAVRHEPYRDLDPDQVVAWAGGPIAVIDCFGILSDDVIRRYLALGCEVKGLGRGHIRRLKDELRMGPQDR